MPPVGTLVTSSSSLAKTSRHPHRQLSRRLDAAENAKDRYDRRWARRDCGAYPGEDWGLLGANATATFRRLCSSLSPPAPEPGVLHIDLKEFVVSIGGYRWVVFAIDEHTRFVFVDFVKSKADAGNAIKRSASPRSTPPSARPSMRPAGLSLGPPCGSSTRTTRAATPRLMLPT